MLMLLHNQWHCTQLLLLLPLRTIVGIPTFVRGTLPFAADILTG